DVKEVSLLYFCDCLARDLSKDAVGLHRINNPNLWDCLNFFLQQSCHAIGVLRIFQPKIASEECVELGGDEPHFRRELHSLLAQEKKIPSESLVKKKNCLRAQDAVL